MEFIIKGPFKDNTYNLMRKAGYHFQGKEIEKEELIFMRPIRSYPRFHLYLKVEGGNLIFNLHLDQKKPSYNGVAPHSGEYDGEIVSTEAERIKRILMFRLNGV